MEDIELIKPCFIGAELEERLAELKRAYLVIEKDLRKLPEGTLYARKSNGIHQYFCKSDTESGSKNCGVKTVPEYISKYIPKKDIEFAKQLAQKRYFLDCRDVVEKQIKSVEKLLKNLRKLEIGDVYGTLPELIRQLVTPVMLSDENYVREWIAGEYGSNGNYEITGGLFTSGGLQVRSKSEVIIGDVMDKMGVPFKYEVPVELERTDRVGSYTAHPDFYCLNVRTRKEFIWEHFGMMDDAEYVEKTVRKLADYEKSGWFYGENMIFTMETGRQPLDTRNVELLVKKFLL